MVSKISETTGPISMSLGIFESTMAYLETIFEFFDFGHSKPLFQLQNEVVSTIPWQYGDKTINQSTRYLCHMQCFWTNENLSLGITQASEKLNTSLTLSNTLKKHDLGVIALMFRYGTTPLRVYPENSFRISDIVWIKRDLFPLAPRGVL